MFFLFSALKSENGKSANYSKKIKIGKMIFPLFSLKIGKWKKTTKQQ
jgi:hypothetical protein